jgi:hypothetical protein
MKRKSAWSADGRDLNALISRKTGEARLLETELRNAKRMVELVQNARAERAKMAHRMATAHLPKDRWYALQAPDGREIRCRHSSAQNLAVDLIPGYRLVGEIFGCDKNGCGGISAPQGATMVEFLESKGAVFIAGPEGDVL